MATAPVALTRPIARRPSRQAWAVGLLAIAAIAFVVLRGQFLLPHDESAPFFQFLNEVRAWIDSNRQGNPVLAFLLANVRGPIAGMVAAFQGILTSLGWTGVTAIMAALGFIFGGWRLAALMVGGFLAFGVLGLWQAAIDTLALTLAAVVIAVLIGVPLGILAGRSDRFMALISPILDVMQIMPTFAYLAPLTLFFLIGPASAVIATLIYALPAAIRITAYGIRGVNPTTVEAATSMGSTRFQTLLKVQVPMARPQIVLAINQTMMLALSMVVITALIDAPGLGKNITRSLETLNVGTAFDAGIAIVIMAIVLDRLTTPSLGARRAPASLGGGRVRQAPSHDPVRCSRRGLARRRHRRLHRDRPDLSGGPRLLVRRSGQRRQRLDQDQRLRLHERGQERGELRVHQPHGVAPDHGAMVAPAGRHLRRRVVHQRLACGHHRDRLPAGDRHARALGAQHADAGDRASWRPC